MIVTTAHTIEGKQVEEYLGVVSAAVVMVLAAGKKGVQRGWQTGVEEATQILKEHAQNLKADAVIAVKYEPHGTNLCVTGTAVRLV